MVTWLNVDMYTVLSPMLELHRCLLLIDQCCAIFPIASSYTGVQFTFCTYILYCGELSE